MEQENDVVQESSPNVEIPEVEAQVDAPEQTEEVAPQKQIPDVPYSALKKKVNKIHEQAEEIEELRKKLNAQSRPQSTESSVSVKGKPELPEPTYNDADDRRNQIKYAEDMANWTYDQREAKRKAEQDQVSAQQKHQQAAQRQEEFFNKDQEYQKLLTEIAANEEDIRYPKAVADVLAESENGPEIDKYILSHRNELIPKLHSMTQSQQLMELGRIQAEINSQPKIQPKLISGAPDVIETNSGGGSIPSEDEQLKSVIGEFTIT